MRWFDTFMYTTVSLAIGALLIIAIATVYMANCKFRTSNTIKKQQETIDSLNVQIENYKLLYKLGE